MGRPLVSVIVPTYNRLVWLPSAVGSVQHQTFRDWELILIDDGSTDETERWARGLHEPPRQLRSHLAEFLRRAVRHRSARQIARIAVALGRA